jgi:hypothetical protein
MREMWRRDARFCTYHDGRFSSLIVDRASDGTCGYWEFEDVGMAWRDALVHAFGKSGLEGRDIEEFVMGQAHAVLRGRSLRSSDPCGKTVRDQRMAVADGVEATAPLLCVHGAIGRVDRPATRGRSCRSP